MSSLPPPPLPPIPLAPAVTTQIPPPLPSVIPKKRRMGWFGFLEQDERNLLEKTEKQTYNIRRAAAYGALALALLLYVCGICAAAVFVGLWKPIPAATAGDWHIVVTTLAAFFTVPTLLILAVIRSTLAPKNEEPFPNSVHEALGQMVTKVVDKVVDSIK